MAASDVEPVAKPQTGKSPNSQHKSTSPQKAGSPQKEPLTVRKEAMNHLVAGKRHMLVQDIAAAVASLATACEMLSAEFGETAVECADAYFHYGKALLEMARLESGVLGNALDGVPEGDDAETSQCEDPEKLTEEEKEEVGVKVMEALDENFQTHEEKIHSLTNGHAKKLDIEESAEGEEDDEESQEEGEESQDEKMEEGEKTNGEAKTETNGTETKNGETETKEKMETESVGEDEKSKTEKEEGDKEEQEAEDDEDPSNLQLAWEMLELAKVIYTKQVTEATGDMVELEKKLCETFLALGEVSLENENYPQAVDDLTACLKKQVEKLPKDSRSIAETHYQLGVAQGFHLHFEEAVKSLNDAITVLTTRIENLKKKTESKDETRTDDAFYTREKEIEELEKLLPEIREKIQDTNEMKEETLRKMKEEAGFSNGAGPSGESAKPVSTIAVKKRAHSQEESKSPKKPHVEEATTTTK